MSVNYLGRSAKIVDANRVALVGPVKKWTRTYNAAGQLLTETGPCTDVNATTVYAYDSTNGNLMTVTNPLGHVTTFSDYDANGRVGSVRAPGGTVTRMTYSSGAPIPT